MSELLMGNDVIKDYLSHLDTIDNNGVMQNHSNAYFYTQRDGSEFLIIESYGDFVKEFNAWVRENSYYYNQIMEEQNHDCLNDEDWWIGYLTDNEWGYSDEYTVCGSCGNVIHYQCSSGYRDNYWINDGELMCEECIKEHADDYINNYLVLNYNTGILSQSIPINRILSKEELKKFSFECVKDNLEVGMYGTYNDPRPILEQLIKENQNTDYICHCVSENPFATYYEIWEREHEE